MTTLRMAVLASLAFAVFTSAAPAANADTITATLPEFRGPVNAGPFPGPVLTVGTFIYAIPSGQVITSATLSGTFGDSVVGSTASFSLLLDGRLVGQCGNLNNDPAATCNSAPADPFTFNITPANFSVLADGSVVLAVQQLGPVLTRLGRTTLTINTQATTAAVPEPATLLLLGTGLAGVGAAVRRGHKAHKDE